MEILFYIVPILIGITFVLMIALMISPKLRGKLMSRQIKATKHMMDYSKEDLKDILSTSADIGINAEKEMEDNVTRKANINKKGIEITTNAIKEGLTRSKIYCKHCGKLIDDDSKFCKSCGKEQ